MTHIVHLFFVHNIYKRMLQHHDATVITQSSVNTKIGQSIKENNSAVMNVVEEMR